ncbi:MAG: TonB-dependent receptor [Luteibaculaceae bacterium]
MSGTVTDKDNGESLIGVTVYIEQPEKRGTTTNVYGFYSLSLPPGEYEVFFSYVGYETQKFTVNFNENRKLDVELGEGTLKLQEVTISDTRGDENVKSVESSVAKLDIKTINKIPPLFGEVDVIRSLQLLPGVSTVGEGAAGFNVRGGGIDQNLVLLDNAPVFNQSHLFGFFSVFNPDAVKDVKLYKGGIPAQYGGRLSSILDIRLKEGNTKRFSGQGGVGVIFSRLALEAPIVKDKGSIIVAGRRSYVDILARPFLPDDLSGSRFYFYDLNLKANYKISEKDRVFVSGSFDRDVFGADIFGFDWGNSTATVRWNRIFTDKLFMNVTGYFSDYVYKLDFGSSNPDANETFVWEAGIKNYSLQTDFTYYLSDISTIKFGAQSVLFEFQPGIAEAQNRLTNQSSRFGLERQFALESAGFVSHNIDLTSRWSFEYGLRVSLWQFLGTGRAIELGESTPNVRRPVVGVEEFGRGEVIENYVIPEPRMSFKYELTDESSIKGSYNRMSQYLHLISNTTAATPLDVWIPSTNNIKPQIADQVSVGYFRNFRNNMFETSVEVFYKDFQNQVDFIDNANLLLNEFLEADLLTGIGRAYGAEFFIRKTKGKFNGWISYTLGRSERRIEGINRGEWFPNRFDQLHSLNTVAIYTFSEKWDFSSTFVLNSGTPTTFPTNRFFLEGIGVLPHNVNQDRNNLRLPAYHRLDLSATYTPAKKEGRKWSSYWTFGVYNVYARRNPFSIFFQANPDQPMNTEAIRFAVLGTAVPSVSYNFQF